MQGIGNDYVYVNLTQEHVSKPEELARKLSDRRFGIGGDGLVLIDKSDKADLSMRMFNADGSESEMCGNAIRCVARYGFEHGLVEKTELTVSTLAGIKFISIQQDDWGRFVSARVNMGVPVLDPARIPALVEGAQVVDHLFDFESYHFQGTLVSMGNPHLVTFVDHVDLAPVSSLGPLIERCKLFPNRINVEFVEVLGPQRAKQRTWERGSGETLGCGTGASAVLVAGVLTGRLKSPAVLELLGGELTLDWAGPGHPLFMTGPATEVFEGSLEL